MDSSIEGRVFRLEDHFTKGLQVQLGGNEIGTPHKRPEHAARLTQVYASNAAVTFVLVV